MPIAQFNIARARWPLDDPRMAAFTNMIDRMNAIAARSDGYIWRLTDETGPDAPVFPGDPRMTFTLSVWRDLESLRIFTWNTIHKRFRLRRSEWFEPLGTEYLVLWPIDDAHRPDGTEALDRLDKLRKDGPGSEVFGTGALKEGPKTA